jgi:SAM-dependent methyltransferase
MLIPPIEFRSRLGKFPTEESWLEAGMSTLFHLREEFGLKAPDQILDLASGCGRVALPILPFIDYEHGGRYCGLDAAKDMVDWCNNNLARFYASFTWADVKNTEYFKEGNTLDYNYRFPYYDQSFSFIFACSLFTHMLNRGTLAYFKEISRVLKKNGSFMASMFIIDMVSTVNMANGNSIFSFPVKENEGCRYELQDRPEATVAYTEDYFNKLLQDSGLKLVHRIRGTWSDGIKDWTQDEVLITHA